MRTTTQPNHQRRLVVWAVLCFIAAGIFSIRASENPSTQGIAPLLVAQSATSSTAVTMGSGTMSRCRESAVYIQWSAGTTAGAVQVETAHDVAYTGTWAPLGSVVNWSAATKEDVVQITGIHAAVRTRISTTVTGGTVSTFIVCN